MSTTRTLYSTFAVVLLAAVFAQAGPPPVSYTRQIQPLFQRECLPCHGGSNPTSGYSMETRDLLVKGGRHGVAVVPGKGAQSSLVRYLSGDIKPKMPPGPNALDKDTIALVQRWIDEGAKFDKITATGKTPARSKVLPAPAPVVSGNQAAPVTALAYAPDGKWLAAGGYQAVRLLDPATGNVVRTLAGRPLADQVQALAWSSDGSRLAAAGGVPGKVGEVVIFDTLTWRPIWTLAGHAEVVQAIAWKPGTHELATGSLDKTTRIWNADSGKCVRVSKDHADAVLALAYSPDGKWLATGSADRSAKLLDTTTWRPVAVFGAHGEAVTALAFHPSGGPLMTTSADKSLCVWPVKPGAPNPDRRQHEGEGINAVAFSPDGSVLAWGASNRVVKIFNGDATQHKRTMNEPKDWVYSVAVARDNQTIAAGTQGGEVLFWNVADGKLLRQVTLRPGSASGAVAQVVKPAAATQ